MAIPYGGRRGHVPLRAGAKHDDDGVVDEGN